LNEGCRFFHEGAKHLLMVSCHAASEVSFSFAIKESAEVGAHRQVDVSFHVAIAGERAVRDSVGDFRGVDREVLAA
jgi:hypothetical protein